ncbi:hypothetical protein E2C01_027811 [Portunus trituberculatus]|uniref:Uncharacterized protein n=1 Tax=Portunus trituberculatus TaxID=210409 RepID=A0A5B7EJM6_PORTR|nr:hypothetical protein [Portunus trituberculatus]
MPCPALLHSHICRVNNVCSGGMPGSDTRRDQMGLSKALGEPKIVIPLGTKESRGGKVLEPHSARVHQSTVPSCINPLCILGIPANSAKLHQPSLLGAPAHSARVHLPVKRLVARHCQRKARHGGRPEWCGIAATGPGMAADQDDVGPGMAASQDDVALPLQGQAGMEWHCRHRARHSASQDGVTLPDMS